MTSNRYWITLIIGEVRIAGENNVQVRVYTGWSPSRLEALGKGAETFSKECPAHGIRKVEAFDHTNDVRRFVASNPELPATEEPTP